jgi:hypothetical protein
MRALAWAVVALVSCFSGGYGIPIGFSLDLSPIEVYLSATIGSIVGLVVFLYAGDAVRRRFVGDADESAPAHDSAMRRVVDRHGARGLGLIGPIFPGVTASVLIGLTMGLRRSEVARWMTIGIAGMFALYTVGLRLLIELVGVE